MLSNLLLLAKLLEMHLCFGEKCWDFKETKFAFVWVTSRAVMGNGKQEILSL